MKTLRDPAAVEVGYQGGERWTVGLREQPAADGQPGLTLEQEHRLRRHRRGREYRFGHHRRSGRGVRRHILPARPGARARPRTTPTCSASLRDKEGLKRDLFARIKARGERATPAMVEKELAALERAQAARAAIDAVRSRRRNRALLQRQPHRRRRGGPGRSTRCASAAGASTCCCTPPAWSAAICCRTRTRASSIWSSTSRATAGSISCMPSATCPSGRPWRSAPLPAASATADRPITAPPTTCCARSPRASAPPGRPRAASPSTGPPGAASAWPRAAPFPK